LIVGRGDRPGARRGAGRRGARSGRGCRGCAGVRRGLESLAAPSAG